MRMSREKERGLTAQPSLLFWRVCSYFFFCPFVSGHGGIEGHRPTKVFAHIHTLMPPSPPNSGVKTKFLLLFALAQLFVYQLTPFCPACQFDWIVWDCSPTPSNKTG
ncbi:hypothetical protein Tc00.1047053506173.150 [Trypanosoma cruzi]|uniref:Uncharacterized protein n=1 Tax=Trypanosoma cruzi (strain CL Brener) TaxID=353153 RepID=Q4E218_TRYCC|nr:uncharacterized protein Tc00.1047053506173.150 [Trypanosoma cruzi]EAN98823.1 hypothetical protein Tc00.1047053506173.150 [Trypanosoma cruzi]|eukprot:XP_820674.1 hypothetical protein Tc00.1047053506173.150 [Trypanosoma cruzi strain CL Brener]